MVKMKYAIFVCLFLCAFHLNFIFGVPYEDVDDMVNKLSTVTQPVVDIFVHLEFVKKNAIPVLNLIGTSLGPLLTVLVKTTGLVCINIFCFCSNLMLKIFCSNQTQKNWRPLKNFTQQWWMDLTLLINNKRHMLVTLNHTQRSFSILRLQSLLLWHV